MMSDFFYPANKAVGEIEKKKSKFISYLYPYSFKNQIMEELRDLRKTHKKAAHIVYAFTTGGKNSVQKGMSDDGEPSGTAGKPLLSILEGNHYTNILIAVVRYYGGIKLGTGGLVKAYSESANLVIKKTEFIKLINEKKLRITFPYEHHGGVLSIIKSFDARTENEKYSNEVSLDVFIKKDTEETFILKIKDSTSGCVDIY